MEEARERPESGHRRLGRDFAAGRRHRHPALPRLQQEVAQLGREDVRIVDVAEGILQRLEPVQGLRHAGHQEHPRLQQVAEVLGGDAGAVNRRGVDVPANPAQPAPKPERRLADLPRRDRRHRPAAPRLVEADRQPDRPELRAESLVEPREAPRVGPEHRRALVPGRFLEAPGEPRHAGPLDRVEPVALPREPGPMHLEVAARPRRSGEAAETAERPAGHARAELPRVAPETAPEPAERHAKVVERLGLRRIPEPDAGRARGLEVIQREEPSALFGGEGRELAGGDHRREGSRRSRKNAERSSPHSAASTPGSTSGR